MSSLVTRLGRFLRMPSCSIFDSSSPVDNRLSLQACVTHLTHQATDVLVLYLLEVGMRQEDIGHYIFLCLDFDIVTDVVWVFTEAVYSRVDEFRYCTRKGKGQTDDTGPEVADPSTQPRSKELYYG